MNHNTTTNPDLLDKFGAAIRQRAAGSSNREVNKVLSFRNDKTHADEARIIIFGIVAVATCFTAYCGYLYYLKAFENSFSPMGRSLAAMALPLIVEIGKTVLTFLALRALFFRWMFRDGWSFGYWLIVLAIGVGAYVWSINISTEGMETITAQQGEERTKGDNLTAYTAKATAEIDKQIALAQTAQTNAQNTRTKKGKTTWQGQVTADKAETRLNSLTAQRDTVLKQATAEYLKGETKREVEVEGWAAWVKKFGGWMEWVTLLGLIANGLFERRLFGENLAMLEEKERKETDLNAAFK